MEPGNLRTEASFWSKRRCRLGSGIHDPQERESVALNFGRMGRATACSAVTWFAVLRNFELMKNSPAWAKIAGAVSFAYRLNRLACAVSGCQLRFRPTGAGASLPPNIEAELINLAFALRAAKSASIFDR
jgi:hypothetical protein